MDNLDPDSVSSTNQHSSLSSSSGRANAWGVLEGLLQTLTETLSSSQSIAATTQAAVEALEADAGFWYSKIQNRVLSYSGHVELSALAAVEVVDAILKSSPNPVQEAWIWANPAPQDQDAAFAIVCESTKANGCLITLYNDRHRVFDDADLRVARLTMKMLISQRTQTQTSIKQILFGLVHSLTNIIDAKDAFMAGHSERVARIATLIAKQLGLSSLQVSDVYLAGLIHNVGNVSIHDDILQKPGKLTEEDWDAIRKHPEIGEGLVKSIKPFERLASVVRHHHEHWNGKGYPDGLQGEEIPLLARILSVADACDAMMSSRRYRPNRSPLDIDAIFKKESGKQFDPQVLKAFLAIRHEVYPPIYQKGVGESAYHAIESLVENLAQDTQPSLYKLLDSDGNK